MADGDSTERRHWQHLPQMLPNEGGAARIQQDNEEMLRRAESNIGVPIYHKNGQPATVTDTAPGGLTWQLRRLPDGNVIRYRDSDTPGKFWTWDPDAGKVEKYLVGDDNHANIEALRTDLAQHPENAYFRSLYPNSYANASVGELNARRFLRDTFKDYHFDPGAIDQINQADTTRKLMEKAEGLFTKLGGKQNLNQLAQSVQNLKTDTDFDNWVGKGTVADRDTRTAFRQLTTVIQQLRAQGIDVGGSGEGKTAPATDKLTETMLLLSKGNPVGALLATAGGGVLNIAKSIASGNFKADELGAQLPALHDQLAKAEAQKVESMSNPAAQTFVPDEQRKMHDDAVNNLESHNLGPDDVSTRILPTYGTSDTAPNAFAKAQTAGGGTAEQATAPTDDAIAKSVARGDMTQKEADAMRARIASANQPSAMPPAETKEPEKGGGPQVTAAPVVTPTPALQAAPIGPVSTTGAPSETGEQFAGKAPIATPPVTPLPQTPATAQTTPANQAPAYNIPPYPTIVKPAGWAPVSGQLTPEQQKGLEEARKPAWAPLSNEQQKALEERVRKAGLPVAPTASAEPVSSNVEVGAPLGTGDAPGINRLHQQEHVDALAPGTPFYWRDHPDAYVRV